MKPAHAKAVKEGQWEQLEPAQWNVRNDRFAVHCLCGEPIAADGKEPSRCPNCGRCYRVVVEVQEPEA